MFKYCRAEHYHQHYHQEEVCTSKSQLILFQARVFPGFLKAGLFLIPHLNKVVVPCRRSFSRQAALFGGRYAGVQRGQSYYHHCQCRHPPRGTVRDLYPSFAFAPPVPYGIPAPTHPTHCLRNSVCERKAAVLCQRAGKIVPSVGY